jgi:hypothetical protein
MKIGSRIRGLGGCGHLGRVIRAGHQAGEKQETLEIPGSTGDNLLCKRVKNVEASRSQGPELNTETGEMMF